MNRRSFIKAGVLLGISPTILNAVEKNTDKKCVYIYLGGGISHVEFLNPIMEAPSEYRSVTGSVKTKTGYELGGNFIKLAQCSDLFTTVRSFAHNDNNHHTAAHWLNTSFKAPDIPEGGPAKEPFYGSVICSEYNSNNSFGMPNYVKVSRIPHDGPAWLGSKCMGYENNAEAIKSLLLEDKNRFSTRIDMLSKINRYDNECIKLRNWDITKDTAVKIINGNVADSFKIELEKEEIKNRYKIASSAFGKNLLTTIRLLENGCKFVSTEHSGWDMHSDILNGFNTRAVELDELLSVFLQDLNDRGLLKDTLVVVCSEFGRTNKINGTAGRDHMPNCNSLILAGAGYGDNLIGKTDSKASAVIDSPYYPADLSWTILNHFNIDKDLTIVDNQGRPRHMIEKEAKIIA